MLKFLSFLKFYLFVFQQNDRHITSPPLTCLFELACLPLSTCLSYLLFRVCLSASLIQSLSHFPFLLSSLPCPLPFLSLSTPLPSLRLPFPPYRHSSARLKLVSEASLSDDKLRGHVRHAAPGRIKTTGTSWEGCSPPRAALAPPRSPRRLPGPLLLVDFLSLPISFVFIHFRGPFLLFCIFSWPFLFPFSFLFMFFLALFTPFFRFDVFS